MRERFIENKRPFNLTHSFPKKEKNQKEGHLEEQF
jgi:hypothetical protein